MPKIKALIIPAKLKEKIELSDQMGGFMSDCSDIH